MQGKIRRIVTGNDKDGKAVIVSDGDAPAVYTDQRRPGRYLTELWVTNQIPVVLGSERDPTLREYTLEPPANGTAFKILELPPDAVLQDLAPADLEEVFATMGNKEASTYAPGARHPMMHKTRTLDLGLILSGEVYLILDDSEVLLREGDVIVQTGTNHAWSNRSDNPVRIAFFMIDGRYPNVHG